MMWFLLQLLNFFAHIETVSSQGNVTCILRSRAGPCEGYVEVYYDDTWGYVGDKFWNKETEKVVCRSTHCGTPVGVSEDVYRPKTGPVWLNELKCAGEENTLWQCPGWPGPGASFYQKPTMKKIKCSNQIKMSLSGYDCAGAVQYSTDGKKPSGYICSKNWGDNEAKLLCKNLGCGGVKERPEAGWMADNNFPTEKNMLINCANIDNPEHLWQCVTGEEKCQNPASVVCEGHTRFQLSGNQSNVCSGELQKEENGAWISVLSNETDPNDKCQKMHCGKSTSPTGINTTQLTCTDKVQIVLTEKCHGEVRVNVNGKNESVCASSWTNKEAELVCKELNCGTMIMSSKRSNGKSGIMDHMRCTGNETSLWHCLAKHGKGLRCSDVPYVMCSGSVDVKLEDGPGKCAGRLAVYYEGQWSRVQKSSWKNEYGDAVCKHLQCGDKMKAGDNEEFAQGSGDFLTMDCNLNLKNISECFTKDQNRQQPNVKAVGIICQEHKVLFLKGSCSGSVGIEENGQTYWLSGSNKTWNRESANTVCQQMRCGNYSKYKTVPNNDGKKNIWKKSYNCSSTTKSLFNCDEITDPSNQTVAHVTCSGKVNIILTNKCRGTVKICTEGQCGGVCADTWTIEKSSMLCKSLDCGDKALKPYKSPQEINIAFKSLHSTNQTTHLSQCNLVKNKDGDNRCTPAYVVCAASVKPRFKDPRGKCSGIVEVEHEGDWIPVQIKDNKTQNAICKELNCGIADTYLDYVGFLSTVTEIAEVTCSEDDASFATCDVQRSKMQTSPLKVLQCSEFRKMDLESVCEGRVIVYSKEKVSAVPKLGWTEREGKRLCQDMNCGDQVLITEHQNNDLSLWKSNFSCTEEAKSIWDCETPNPHSSNPTLKLVCKDRPSVTLTGTCQGEVKINNVTVCSDHWNIAYANMVCQEQNCGNAIDDLLQGTPMSEEMYHVRCDDHHYRLGQCERVKGPCAKGSVSISCTENVKFNTTEKCGGAIKVRYHDKWVKVCSLDLKLSDNTKNHICKMIGCSSSKKDNPPPQSVTKEVLQSSLICPLDYNDARYCLKKQPCNNGNVASPAVIYCQGYKRQTTIKTEPSSPRWALIIIGVGALLIVLIVAAVFVRSYIRRTRKARLPPRMMSGTEDEFESGNYEDIINKSNEMEHFSRGRFRSESEFIKEREMRGSSSFNYDDVDEANEVVPLTPPGFTVAGPRENNMTGGALNQSDDGVMYEVDDVQENYDDIDTCPETIQTKAEVHDGQKTTPESDPAGPQGKEKRDEDYLVPGQDG